MALNLNNEQLSERGNFVENFVREMEEDSERDRRRWRENMRQFIFGSEFDDKDEWQSNYTLDKYQTLVRAAAGAGRGVLFLDPEWYVFDPVNPNNDLAVRLAEVFKKWLDFELEQANHKRKLSTVLLYCYISMGSIYVGKTVKLVQNPRFVEREERRQSAPGRKARAKIVTNPTIGIEDTFAVQQSIERAINSITDIAFRNGTPEIEEDVEPYVEIPILDIQVIDPLNRFWDTKQDYIAESRRNAMRTYMELWQLKEEAELGFFDKGAVNNIKDNVASTRVKTLTKNLAPALNRRTLRSTLVEVITYFGPLIIDNEVKKPRWGSVIANGEMIKEWNEYPFWEPVNHVLSPIIDCAVKEVPARATGAGAGDNAVNNCRWLDSNMNMATDAMRLNMAGITAVNYLNLADHSILESGGIAPGVIVETLGPPGDTIKHINLTNNIENQFSPVNQILTDSIGEQIGIDDISLGGRPSRSRVTAAETRARVGGTERAVNNAAIDIEQGLLVPFIQKCFARILQFGLPNIENNIGLKQVLDESEIKLLSGLRDRDRLEVLNSWYRVKISGFSSEINRNETLDNYNEILSITSQPGGVLGQIVNVQELFKDLLRNMKVRNIDKILIPNTEMGVVTRENQLLILDKFVEVSEEDDHELHIPSHSVLVNSPQRTQALVEHLQQHLVMQQNIQQAQGQSAELAGGAQQGQQGLPGLSNGSQPGSALVQ